MDSQPGRIEQNEESIRNLYDNLRHQGDEPDRMPLVVQYNKRDLPGVLPVSELRARLRIPNEVIEVEACALKGRGVFETLKYITKACLKLVGEPRDLPQGRSPSILPGSRASMYRDLRSDAPVVRMPRPPRLPSVDE